MTTFERLKVLFDSNAARYRLIEHPVEGRSDQVAVLRGTSPSQAAKAMICELAGSAPTYALVVLAGDRRLNFEAVAKHFGVKKARMASLATAEAITGCLSGSIPPVSFRADLPLVADSDLLDRESELAFNAGRLDCSIVINTADYCRIVSPETARVAIPR